MKTLDIMMQIYYMKIGISNENSIKKVRHSFKLQVVRNYVKKIKNDEEE